MDHPQLGPLYYISAEGIWLGRTSENHEICIAGDFFEDRPDAACEALAIRELMDLPGLLSRIEAFLATVREPYLDQWASRRWEVNSLVFSMVDDQPTFFAQYLLERDDYTRWLVHVKDGVPVRLERA